jgi:hypothetical protein
MEGPYGAAVGAQERESGEGRRAGSGLKMSCARGSGSKISCACGSGSKVSCACSSGLKISCARGGLTGGTGGAGSVLSYMFCASTSARAAISSNCMTVKLRVYVPALPKLCVSSATVSALARAALRAGRAALADEAERWSGRAKSRRGGTICALRVSRGRPSTLAASAGTAAAVVAERKS